MAIFYPPFDTDDLPEIDQAGDHAEREVLEALAKMDDRWRVFHALHWREIDARAGERSGEIDLIIFHPDCGLIVIEVKGGGVSLENGLWSYVSLFDGTIYPMQKSPLEQARRNRYYLFDKLKGTTIGHDFLTQTALTYTVWFPAIAWTGDLPPEIPNGGFVLDSRHLQNTSKHLRKIMSQAAPQSASWTQQQVEVLIRTLAPEFNLSPPVGVALGELNDRLLKMTEGQIKILRALRNQKQLLVEGCAGSGKTLLAVRLAHDHIGEGKRVLFTCYNKNLADYVATEFQGLDSVDVCNYHELIKSIRGKFSLPYQEPVNEGERQAFFNEQCPELLMEASQYVTSRYDTIIVDEALDFKETWWISLESLGAENFSYYIFYDRNQNIFNDALPWSPPISAEPVVLDQNVRNTKPIGDYAVKLGNIKGTQDYAVSGGPKPVIIKYGSIPEIPGIIKGLLDDLIKRQKVSPADIVILSPYKYTSEHLGLKDYINRQPELFSTQIAPLKGDKVRIGTIQGFKGLEAKVVILCGIDGLDKACKRANLYVGATRARTLLYVIHQKDIVL